MCDRHEALRIGPGVNQGYCRCTAVIIVMVAFARLMAKLRKTHAKYVLIFLIKLPACGHIQTRQLQIVMPFTSSHNK